MSLRMAAYVRGFCRALLAVLTLCSATNAAAWGERGHDLITRVAARLVDERTDHDPRIAHVFLAKEYQLAHLANVPDIVWRNESKAIANLNAPTHFLDSEYLQAKPTFANLPRLVADAERMANAHGKSFMKDVGTAPWRAAQLDHLLQDALRTLTNNNKNSTNVYLQALTYAGLLSHFIGDLAQPMHTTKDYDGWERQQGGLHVYFETEVVDALSLDLDATVYQKALAERPYLALVKRDAKDAATLGKTIEGDALESALALAADSHDHLDELFTLDKSTSLEKPSMTSPKRTAAIRKPARLVADAYRPLVVSRLALAADTLASLWLAAWETAGKPDLGAYHSFSYVLAPDFIEPAY